MMNLYFFIILVLFALSCESQNQDHQQKDVSVIETEDTIITPAANLIDEYLPLIKNKRVALLVNHTALVGNTHLVDTLLSLGIEIKKIFAPEHGFRGNNQRGEVFSNNVDEKTGLPVISLIGKKKQPDNGDLQDVDIVIYDVQDVGCRFYTYISSMYLLMQACAKNNKPLIILDRPNPNGDYVAGPVLDTSNYRSFVGMLPIPVVYGMTAGELAMMINGENWLNTSQKCDLTVIKVKNYRHSLHYSLPVKPSPNLPNDVSIRLYPSLCFFEATNFSIGRGTDFPFQVIGYPDKRFGSFTFTPKDNEAQTNPVQEGKLCYGIDLRKISLESKFTLDYIIKFYQLSGTDINFFVRPQWFDLLMGTNTVRKLIQQGKSVSEIQTSWQNDLENFKQKRQKYLLYD
jgi:uncharacterized protein YbbC (DUF1343 family)